MQEEELTELVTEYPLSYPTSYSMLDLTEDSITYVPRRVNVDAWAKATGQTAAELLHFSRWQDDMLRQYSYDNIDYMNSLGEVIWLKADPEVLYKHLLMGKTERPLLKGKSPEELITFIREQLEKREPFYSKARHVLNVNLMDTYEKINISVTKAKELLHL
jgi:hypothetical protein